MGLIISIVYGGMVQEDQLENQINNGMEARVCSTLDAGTIPPQGLQGVYRLQEDRRLQGDHWSP